MASGLYCSSICWQLTMFPPVAGHLLLVSLLETQKAVVNPEADEGSLPGVHLRLGYLVLVVREYDVLTAAVYVDVVSQQAQGHG